MPPSGQCFTTWVSTKEAARLEKVAVILHRQGKIAKGTRYAITKFALLSLVTGTTKDGRNGTRTTSKDATSEEPEDD